MTLLTGALIAALCFVAFVRLNRIPGKQKLQRYLKSYFLIFGFGSLLAALLGHGFHYRLSPAWKLPGWLTCMVSAAVIEQATILILSQSDRNIRIRVLGIQNIVSLAVFMVLTSVTENFYFVVAYITYSLLIVMGSMHLVIFSRSGARGSLWFILALGVALTGNLVFLFQWNIHAWFNKMDFSHVLLAFSAWCFYRGAKMFMNELVSDTASLHEDSGLPAM